MAQLSDTWTGPPASFDDGDDLDGSVLRTILDNIEAAVNSINDSQISASAAIDGTKIADTSITATQLAATSIQEGKILYDDATNGVQVLRVAAPQRVCIAGDIAFDMNSLASDSVAIDFGTDGHDTPSDPASATDLTIICTLEYDGTGFPLTVYTTSHATTGFTAVVETCDGATTSTATGTIHWVAFGRSA